MLAAAKEDSIEFVRYTGVHTDYPEWFLEYLTDGYVTSEFGSDIFTDENGELAICEGDVFLVNSLGMIHYMTAVEFSDKFYEVF